MGRNVLALCSVVPVVTVVYRSLCQWNINVHGHGKYFFAAQIGRVGVEFQSTRVDRRVQGVVYRPGPYVAVRDSPLYAVASSRVVVRCFGGVACSDPRFRLHVLHVAGHAHYFL